MSDRAHLVKAIGPGLLFAGASIGASHLVQSTRAGTGYGLALLTVIVLANVVKYPAFSFAPRYTAATGVSLLEGYRRQGRWALLLYAGITLLSMFTIQAAVTFVAAGMAIALFGANWDPFWISVGLMATCLALLRLGSYRWLDRIIKVTMVLLTLGTCAATIMALPRIDWLQPWWPSWEVLSTPQTFFFIAALVGWMPTAIDLSIWHSLWALARRRDTGHAPTVSESLIDFNIGYIGTAVLGVCFLLLGAGVLFGKNVTLPAHPVGFCTAIIQLYTETLGQWARPVFGFAGFLVMFSTTLTVVDGFPRAISALLARWQRAEEQEEQVGTSRGTPYWITATVITVGSLIILREFLANLKSLVDLATTISLVTAPPLAWLNHQCMFCKDVPAAAQPGRGMRNVSLAFMGIQAVLATLYLIARFG